MSIKNNLNLLNYFKKIPLVLLSVMILSIIVNNDNIIKLPFFNKTILYIIGLIPIIKFLLPREISFYFDSFKSEIWKNFNYPEFSEKLGDREFIKNQMEILSRITKNKKKIVYIDELDRCSKETINSFFRAIEVFLPVKGFIYIISINPSVIYPAVAKENEYLYSSDLNFQNLKLEGKKYIDKYINIPIALSIPESYDMFIQGIYDYEVSGESENIKEDEVVFKSDYTLRYSKLINLINKSCNVYPRDIKRLLGSIELRTKRLDYIKEDQLTFLVIMNYFFEDFLVFFDYNYFEKNDELKVEKYFLSKKKSSENVTYEKSLTRNELDICNLFEEVLRNFSKITYIDLYDEIILLSKTV